MSAELLRRAAETLRNHAAEAVVGGRWEYRDRSDDPDTFPWTVYSPFAKFNAGTGFAPGTARYMALMDLPVALALADHLEAIAPLFDGLADDGVDDGHEAIRLARAILREVADVRP